MRRALTATEIDGLLRELGRRLETRGVAADMFVFGGAAVAMAHDERRTTVDVDGYFGRDREVAAQARAMAREIGLPDGWLSEDGAGFLPGLATGWAAEATVYGD